MAFIVTTIFAIVSSVVFGMMADYALQCSALAIDLNSTLQEEILD